MIAEENLIRKINDLPPGKINEVIDFVDFLAARESTVHKTELAAMIAAYADDNARTEFDLDEDLENAGIEHLMTIDGDSQ